MLDEKVLFLVLLGTIIFYCYYLNYHHQSKKKVTKEGFENELGDIINPSQDPYKIKKLIETEKTQAFSVRVWDNHSKLKSIYPKDMPQTRDKCPQKNQKEGINCPFSIWRPSPTSGYNSLGDVATITFMSPHNEKIVDVRADKSPGNIYHKNIDTIAVAGADLKEPEDYIYVGGFGTGQMLDRLEKNEEYYRLLGQLKFYGSKLSEALNNKKTQFETTIRKYQNNLNSDFGAQINQLRKSSSIKPNSGQSMTYLKTAIGSDQYPNRDGLEFLRDQPQPTGNIFVYSVTYDPITLNNPYHIIPLINTLPPTVANELRKSLGDNISWTTQTIPSYSYAIWNLQSITDLYYTRDGEGRINYYNLNHYTRKASTFGNEPNSRCHNNDGTRHSKFTSLPGVQFEINHDIKKGSGVRVSNNSTFFGKQNAPDSTCLIYHQVGGTDMETHHLNGLKLRIHPGISNDSKNVFTSDPMIKKLYQNFKDSIEMIKKLYPDLSQTDYKRLSIWQPVPPEGYVAMGFVFTNDPETKKPGKGLCKCIPKNCAKNFKRRPWDPEQDLVFRYSEGGQDLAFYRNPYLSTLVVMDEKKQNGVFKGKTPDHLKYRNNKESQKWECFDIVPCIKECDYIERLEEADKRARGVCRAYSGLENKFFEKQEYRKSLLDEEKKLRELVKTRHNHITYLMERLNKMMSEEDLYKLINQGLNRHKLRTDLEKQKILHGQVANKLMKTRGLEINWNAPEELKKFKDLLKRYVIARYSVQAPKRDCPVCKLPEEQGYIKMDNLEMCYGCLEDVVRELVNKKKAEGEVPAELKELEAKINKKASDVTPSA